MPRSKWSKWHNLLGLSKAEKFSLNISINLRTP
jgi:hypothetical protein